MAFWPSRIDFQLDDNVAGELNLLVEYAARLPELIKLANEQEYDFTAAIVVRKIAKDASIDYSIAARIFNSLEYLRALSDEAGGPDRAFEQVRRAVEPEQQEKLDTAKDNIIAAIKAYDGDNAVSISFKAQKLTYLREKLFHELEIITDARPVFDLKGERILEMVVTHSLVITYWARTGFETIHLALDAADLFSVRKATDRAIIKAKTLKDALSAQWKTRVVRDDNTGSRT